MGRHQAPFLRAPSFEYVFPFFFLFFSFLNFFLPDQSVPNFKHSLSQGCWPAEEDFQAQTLYFPSPFVAVPIL